MYNDYSQVLCMLCEWYYGSDKFDNLAIFMVLSPVEYLLSYAVKLKILHFVSFCRSF